MRTRGFCRAATVQCSRALRLKTAGDVSVGFAKKPSLGMRCSREGKRRARDMIRVWGFLVLSFGG